MSSPGDTETFLRHLEALETRAWPRHFAEPELRSSPVAVGEITLVASKAGAGVGLTQRGDAEKMVERSGGMLIPKPQFRCPGIARSEPAPAVSVR
jgi:hypothetical protein